MSVDQTRREIRAPEVDDLFRIVFAKTDNAAIVHRHVSVMNLAAEDVDELSVFEEQFRGFLSARDAEFMLDVFHNKTRSATGCSGVAPAGFDEVRP